MRTRVSVVRARELQHFKRSPLPSLLPPSHAQYHNMELALESIESQRAAMYPGEPSYNADFFLQYPNGTIYNERQTPGDQCA